MGGVYTPRGSPTMCLVSCGASTILGSPPGRRRLRTDAAGEAVLLGGSVDDMDSGRQGAMSFAMQRLY